MKKAFIVSTLLNMGFISRFVLIGFLSLILI
jgi:hypothetical protein